MQFWQLTIAGEVHEFKRPCALARSAIYPVVSDLDLEAEYSSIDNLLKSPATTFQDKIDEAWVRVIQRVRDQGNLEYLIMSPESLRSCHLNLTLFFFYILSNYFKHFYPVFQLYLAFTTFKRPM